MAERVMDAELSAEEEEILDAVLDSDVASEAAERRQLNLAFGATAVFVVSFMLLSAVWGIADDLIDGFSDETNESD